ncbi:MAG: hypothetical protein HEQ34_06220 [Sphingorhabdus sp.]|uniref:hypothetical protein n=1 Tax=Sphingorhabdus sp. TaxID=1902408 RepID=UPI0025F897F3|nr:hypothetical protein [Sphingorhabdus sp.]MCO4091533.1 hypothetical protein [Sphingorhabdus sp.]
MTTKRRIGIVKGADDDAYDQEKALQSAGCHKIIRVVRGENIKALLRATDKNLQSGDTIVVQKLHVLSTSSVNLSRRFRQTATKGVTLALLWQICNLGDSLFVRSVIHRELAYGGWRWLVIGGMILRLG